MPFVSVYVDESGDLGFQKNSSKFFVVSYVMIVNKRIDEIEGLVKRILKNINITKRTRKKIREFKFSRDSDITRIKFLKKINNFDVKIGVVAISKDSVKDHLKKDTSLLYNYAVIDSVMRTIVDEYLIKQDPYNRIVFVIDQSLSSIQRRSFNEYAESKVEYLTSRKSWDIEVTIFINHRDSAYEKLLQVADYVAGATRYMITSGNSKYFDIIETKIKHKDKWDWKNKINW